MVRTTFGRAVNIKVSEFTLNLIRNRFGEGGNRERGVGF